MKGEPQNAALPAAGGTGVPALPAAVARAMPAAAAAALTGTLGLAAACWGIAVWPLAQKLLPAKAAVDVPLALAIVGLGIWIVLAPSSVPGLVPPM